MTQEQASPETVEIPAPVQTPSAPVEAPEAEPQTEEPTIEDTPPEFDPAAWTENPKYQEHRQEIEEEAHRQGQLREAGRRKELIQFHTQIANGISDFNQTLREAQESGTLDARTFQQAIARYAPALQAYAQYNEQNLTSMKDEHGAIVAASWVAQMANQMGAPDLAAKYVPRLITQSGQRDDGNPAFTQSAEFELDGGAKAFQSFVKDVVKHVESTADKKGYERGLKDGREGKDEAVKIATREGKGPAAVSGTAGGKSDAEILADPHSPIEQIIEIRNRQKAAGQ